MGFYYYVHTTRKENASRNSAVEAPKDDRNFRSSTLHTTAILLSLSFLVHYRQVLRVGNFSECLRPMSGQEPTYRIVGWERGGGREDLKG